MISHRSTLILLLTVVFAASLTIGATIATLAMENKIERIEDKWEQKLEVLK